MTPATELPTVLNEGQIVRQLAVIQSQPKVLAHYVEQLKHRFILKTEDQTAQLRTHFLRTQIEQLELGKQYKGLVHDLQAMERDQENRLLRLELEKRDLEIKREQVDALQGLHLDKQRLSLELEIEELKAKKKALNRRPRAEEPKLSAEQQRRVRRLEVEDKIRELDRLEEVAIKAARSDEDRMRIKNMHADKREELTQQLSKYLV